MTERYYITFETPLITLEKMAEKSKEYMEKIFEIFEKRNIKFIDAKQLVRLYGVNKRLERKDIYTRFKFYYEEPLLYAAELSRDNLESILTLIELIPNADIKARSSITIRYEGKEIIDADLKQMAIAPNVEIIND